MVLETGEFRAFLFELLWEVEAELREEQVALEQCVDVEGSYDESVDLEADEEE